MANSDTSGTKLTTTELNNPEEVAVKIAEMWTRYNEQRRLALSANEETRKFLFATDIDSTSAAILPHKNRTHLPKLTEISDSLQGEYHTAALGTPDFFRYMAPIDELEKAQKIEKWVRQKMEDRKFRDTVGRELIADYVNFGNAFARIEYVVDVTPVGTTLYKGFEIQRISPNDLVFDATARSFSKAPKVMRMMMHIAEVANLPKQFPGSGFKPAAIKEAIEYRGQAYLDDWVQVIKDRGLTMDGFSSWDQYFKQDLVELLIYFGDVFNPENGDLQTKRIVYVMDRCHVIRNEPNKAPLGFDSLHHARWRIRTDNLWGQGPFDNLLGVQYRIDHLENLKADIFDLIAHPIIVIKGDEVEEPVNGFAPGAVYRIGAECDIETKQPDATALNANTEISIYIRYMEDFAGVPPTTQGIRTPGEKSAFEVDTLNNNGSKKFIDKAKSFELFLEGILKEAFELMLANYDGSDYVTITNDVTGEEELKKLAAEDVQSRGKFVAMGSTHWQRRAKRLQEINQFLLGPAQNPQIAQHISGLHMAEFLEREMNFEDEEIITPYAGVREQVISQAVAAEEKQKYQQAVGQSIDSQNNPLAGGTATGRPDEGSATPDTSAGQPPTS